MTIKPPRDCVPWREMFTRMLTPTPTPECLTFAHLANLPEEQWKFVRGDAAYQLYPQAVDLRGIVHNLKNGHPVPIVSSLTSTKRRRLCAFVRK